MDSKSKAGDALNTIRREYGAPQKLRFDVAKNKQENTQNTNDKLGSKVSNNLCLNQIYTIKVQLRVSLEKSEKNGTESCPGKTYLKYSGIMGYDGYARRCPEPVQGYRGLTAEFNPIRYLIHHYTKFDPNECDGCGILPCCIAEN
jgi:hypothetical protein